MMKVFMKSILLIFLSCVTVQLSAQQFINQGMIEYEVKINNHKAMSDGEFAEMFKDKIPKLSTAYYQLFFNAEKSIYIFNRKQDEVRIMWDNGNSDENIWFTDFVKSSFIQQKSVFGETYILTDSLININWKITNETREIAGFNCRKAIGKIFDSVYVFAFYTDEITVSGGPMSLHGLPGMIMGITIPRMFSSWVATKLQLNGVDDKKLTPPTKGIKKKAKDLAGTVIKATKDWGSYGTQAYWSIFL